MKTALVAVAASFAVLAQSTPSDPAAILAARTADGSDTPLFDTAYPQGTRPGEWRFTPGNDFAFAPGWSGCGTL